MNKIQKLTILIIAISCLIQISYSQQQPIQLQAGDVKISKVELTVQKTPEFPAANVTDKRIDRPREWFEFEVEFEVKKRADKNAIVKELQFKYYAGFRDESTKQPAVLSGDATHINILLNEETYSAAYIHPSTIGKLTGDYRAANENAVLVYGVEVFYNGILVGLWVSDNNTQQPFWRRNTTAQPNTILPRDKTPFRLLWIDRYPESKIQ